MAYFIYNWAGGILASRATLLYIYFIYNWGRRNPGVESYSIIYIYIYMGPIGGGGAGGGPEFFGPPSKNLLGHSYKIMEISAGSLAQAQSVGTLLKQIG